MYWFGGFRIEDHAGEEAEQVALKGVQIGLCRVVKRLRGHSPDPLCIYSIPQRFLRQLGLGREGNMQIANGSIRRRIQRAHRGMKQQARELTYKHCDELRLCRRRGPGLDFSRQASSLVVSGYCLFLNYRGEWLSTIAVSNRLRRTLFARPESSCTERHRRASTSFIPSGGVLTNLEGTPAPASQ